MKTFVVFLGTFLGPMLACDSHDMVKPNSATHPPVVAATNSSGGTDKQPTTPAPPKPVQKPTGKERDARPPRPSYLFL